MHNFILKLMFPGTIEEYGRRRDFFAEMRVYRRRWHSLLGCLLLQMPALMIVRSGSRPEKIGILLMVVGFVFVHDTITAHYSLKLLRERKAQSR